MIGSKQVQAIIGAAWIILFAWGCSAPPSSSAVTAAPTPVAIPGGKWIIGYYPSWAAARGVFVKDIPATKLTHINYAFSNVSFGGECRLGDGQADTGRLYLAAESVSGRDEPDSLPFHGNFSQLLELKQAHPDLKILISIGGWTWSSNFSAAAKDGPSRQRFASSCIDLYLKQFEGVFDGLDIDWEYPVSGGLVPGKPEDKKNFTLLLGELRRQLDELGTTNSRHYLLTIAAPPGSGTMRNMELAAIAPIVDWINLMGYDLHGTWESSTGFNAPLYESSTDPAGAGNTVDGAVQGYLAAGVPAGKLTLGVPFYGHGWQGVADVEHGLYQAAGGAAPGTWEAGSFEYKDIRQKYLPTYERYWEPGAYVPWLYDTQSQIFISYDDAQSLEAKAGYARDQGLAGVMIWELTQGDEELLDAIHKGLAAGGPARPTPAPKVTVPRPFEKEIHSMSGVTIDGQLQEWPEQPDFVLNDQSQAAYSLAPKSWGGPQDLSAEAWVGWAPEGLYFAFKVIDDVHVQPTADADLWHGDHVELQLDTLLDKDYTNPGMNDDDYQIGLSLGDLKKVPPIAYAWFNGPEAPGPVQAIRMAYTLTEDGYILETFIPADSLAGLALVEGSAFGMNISPSDADNAGQGQKVMLSTSTIRTYADPRTFGKITLVK
jgi:GH18 family chitinase